MAWHAGAVRYSGWSGDLIQTAILILSGLAFWLSTSKTPHWAGYAIGVVAQPLWIYDTWQHGQWGMFLLSLCFLFGYARGLLRSKNLKPISPAVREAAATNLLAAAINRRVKVEQELFDCAAGKQALPDAAKCRELALKLGTPV